MTLFFFLSLFMCCDAVPDDAAISDLKVCIKIALTEYQFVVKKSHLSAFCGG